MTNAGKNAGNHAGKNADNHTVNNTTDAAAENHGAMGGRLLLVDDEPQALLSFGTLLKSAGMRNVATIDDSRRVIPFLEKFPVSLVLLDLSMPFMSGREVLAQIRQQFPEIPVVIMTATNEIETAVECMQAGAVDYLVKPVEKNRFLSSVRRALEILQLRREVRQMGKYILSDHLENPDAFAHIITANKKMLAIFRYIEAICDSPQPVIITGETGVGKELIARSLHLCCRADREFVAVNVAGLDDTMFSDTLFGHRKGAFTGADGVREGLIARAEGGTIFLDEIGDLNPQSQVKLLRLIQENEYYALGADVPRKTTAHVVVATNRDFGELMNSNQFRKDLYFRLSAHHVHVPPLRERKEDIPLLLRHFIGKAARSLDKNPPTAPPQLVTLLAHHDFPGNVRELESLVYDAVSRHKTGLLPLESFKRAINGAPTADGAGHAMADHTTENLDAGGPIEQVFGRFPTLKQMEHYLVEEALKRADSNQGLAAGFLGITRQALNKRLCRRKKADG